MAKMSMYRLATGRVAAADLKSVMEAIIDLGFQIQTRNKFLLVAQLLTDISIFDTVYAMSDEEYQNIYGELTGGKLLTENTGYNPDEWKDEEKSPYDMLDVDNLPPEQQQLVKKKSIRSMVALLKRAGQLEQMAELISKLKNAGFKMDTREAALQVLMLLAQSGKGYASETAAFMGDMSDEDYIYLVGGPSAPPSHSAPAAPGVDVPPQSVSPPVTQPSQPLPPQTPPPLPKAQVQPTPVPPPLPGKAVQPTPAQPSQVDRRTPGVLSATPQMQFSKLKFDPEQKTKLKSEMHKNFDEMADRAQKEVPYNRVMLGDDIVGPDGRNLLVKNKSQPSRDPAVLANEKPDTRIKAGQYVANYDKGMTEAMVLGATPQGKLVVVTFPDGGGTDPGAQLAVWDPVRDNLRFSAHQAPIRVAMVNILAQMGGGQAQDPHGNPIVPGDMIDDPNNTSMQNGGQVTDIKQDGSIIYQNDQGQKVMKNPGSSVEVIKREGPDGQISQTPQQPGVGGPVMT
jgi:hypothetical protein